jgi:prepilin-type N-terminal cleavage/methylation domain-containing protein
MVNFKPLRSGMTLIEVMFALAIIAIVLTPIFVTQGSSLRQIVEKTNTLKRLFKAQELLCQADMAIAEGKTVPESQNSNNPRMQTTYKETDPVQGSGLAAYPNVKLRTLRWRWGFGGSNSLDTLVSVVYREPQQEKKEQAA